MSTPRLLLLENDPIDAKAIQAILTDGDMDYELLRVETRADFVTALETQAVDLILANCAMPDFDGIATLEIAAALRPEVPLIIVAASLDEERAIALLNQGATDYVLKPRLGRLVLAVQRALRETSERRNRQRAERMLVEQKQLLQLIALGHPLDECLTAVCASVSQLSPSTEWEYQLAEFGAQVASVVFERDRANLALRESEEQSRNILESITDAFVSLDENWQFIYVNQFAEIMLDRAPSDLIGKNLWEEYPGLAGSEFEAVYVGAMRDRVADSFTAFYPDHDRWYEVHVYPAKNGISAYFRNVTDRIQAAETLRQTSAALEQQVQKFEAVKSSVPDFIYTFDLAGRFIDVNQPLLDLWQKTLAEAIGKNFFELEYPVDLAAKLQNQIQEVIQTRQSIRDETPYTSAISTRAYEYIFVPIFNAENAVEMVAGVTRDITDRTAAEAELRESEARFRHVADTAPVLIWMARTDKLCYYFNQTWLDFTGRTMEQEMGNGWAEGVHPDDFQRCLNTYVTAFDARQPFQMEYRLKRFDGAYRWLTDIGVPRFTATGDFLGYIGSCGDIDDLKAAEAELRESEVRFRTLADNMSQFAWMADPNGWIFWYNHRWFEYTGTTLEEMQGWGWQQVHHPDHVDRVVEHFSRCIETGETWEDTFPLRGKDGNYRWFLSRAIPIKDEAGNIVSWFGTNTDISDRKRIEAEREQMLQQEQAAREAAEQANRMKDEFLAVVSHELRTPLNPILGWSKLLRSGKLSPEKVAAALGTIERNAQQQAQLIDDLLDISRILQNKLTLAIAPVDLAVTVTDALETVRLTAEAKSIQLRSSLAANVGAIMGDASRLQQIVWNLLSNAIKFTPENGQVEVRLEKCHGTGNREQGIGNGAGTSNLSPFTFHLSPSTSNLSPFTSYAQITVTDTGKGILPEFLPHLFEAFRQEDATTKLIVIYFFQTDPLTARVSSPILCNLNADQLTRQFGGLGLGLSIVQQLTTLHGGTITAASDGERKGATFTVRFPIALRQSTNPIASTQGQTIDLSGIRILVVDDILDSQEFVVCALKQAGAIVTPASSAQMALELLAQMKPDVIISDIGMPDLNGYELLQQIRSDFIQLQTIPAIALSAYASQLDQQQALAAGFQCHLAKPIDLDVLFKTVARLTQAFR